MFVGAQSQLPISGVYGCGRACLDCFCLTPSIEFVCLLFSQIIDKKNLQVGYRGDLASRGIGARADQTSGLATGSRAMADQTSEIEIGSWAMAR
jgi:hypothetical protein